MFQMTVKTTGPVLLKRLFIYSFCWKRVTVTNGGIKMNVDLIFKIAAIGIIVAVLNQLLIRSGREEQAMMTTLAGLIVVLLMIVNEISNLFETVKNVFGLW
jgi:stage III sporulation protein AC